MDLKAKIELIEILQKKLHVGNSWKMATTLDEETADLVLQQLKDKVIEVAREKTESAEKKKRTNHYVKQWCRLHKLDYSILED